MDKNIKLFAFDLDGTTLNDNSDMPNGCDVALKSLKEKGIITVICTGRTYCEIELSLRSCPYIDYIIYSDGAAICDKMGNMIFTDIMSPQLCEKLKNTLNEFDTLTEVYTVGNPIAPSKILDEKVMDYYHIENDYRDVIKRTRATCDNPFDSLKKRGAEMLNIFFSSYDERERFLALCKNDSDIHVSFSMQSNAEIMKASVNKAFALKYLCKYLNIEKEYTASVGDSNNDCEMLRYTALSFAPSNACDKAKSIADFTVCSNNDGVIEYIAKNYLI